MKDNVKKSKGILRVIKKARVTQSKLEFLTVDFLPLGHSSRSLGASYTSRRLQEVPGIRSRHPRDCYKLHYKLLRVLRVGSSRLPSSHYYLHSVSRTSRTFYFRILSGPSRGSQRPSWQRERDPREDPLGSGRIP